VPNCRMTTNPLYKHKSFIRSVLDPKDCVFCLETSPDINQNYICKCQYYYHNNCANLNLKDNSYKCPLCRAIFKIDIEMSLIKFPEIIEYLNMKYPYDSIITSIPSQPSLINKICKWYLKAFITIVITLFILLYLILLN